MIDFDQGLGRTSLRTGFPILQTYALNLIDLALVHFRTTSVLSVQEDIYSLQFCACARRARHTPL